MAKQCVLEHSLKYVFLRFFENPKTRLFTCIFEMPCQKNVKKRRKRCPSFFIFLHFEIANGHFHCKTITITHVMLYIQHYIKTVHVWLKYNGFAIVRKTTKLIEGGHCGLQDYMHCIYVITSTFFTFFTFFKFTFFAVFRTFSRTMF